MSKTFTAESLRIYSFDIGYTSKKNYNYNNKEKSKMKYTTSEAGKLVDEKASKYIEENLGVTYDRAVIKVLELNPELAKAYTKGAALKKEYSEKEEAASKKDASAQINFFIEETMLTHNVSFERAMDYVMKHPDNKELVKTYIGV